ncbi:MAG: 3-oxoacyl-ACP synthase [Candidatus Marinimicrobia bacterium]|nr:3-oxoacyl-ACP synthase [Candidatus Neomarinimicrobiota bacterium]|tara:strand:- start:1287 stop:2279 length:993 start_codon:yes stop_codon:yes gene_type:complete
MYKAYISGIGHYLPEKIITNDDLSKIMDTSNEWIYERTGIKQRHYVSPGQGPSDLAIPATENALKMANLSVKDIDLIIFATSTPDYYAPGSGCLLQDKMGFQTIGALDIRVQCSGFVYGLSIANQYIKTGEAKNVLVVGAEVQSTTLDLSTKGRDTAVIFADGAGAAILTSTDEGKGILSTHIHSEGKFAKELWVESPSTIDSPRLSQEILDEGKHFLYMNGREVFRNAVKRFPEIIMEALDAHNMSSGDIDLLIPHQANIRIIEFIAKKINIPMDKIISNINRVGNTTAASIPIAFSEALIEGKIKKGQNIILAAFGSGFTWASAAIKW